MEGRPDGHAKLEVFDDEGARLIAEAEQLFGRPLRFSALDRIDIVSVRASDPRR